ncbi:uncharacterized protein [Engystomops pustulosus]|uniref:uncharacterized protein isoform X1 n=1 Tax=Engystomops pustulosus TaxID=76066 RepID=UPI003AFAF75A
MAAVLETLKPVQFGAVSAAEDYMSRHPPRPLPAELMLPLPVLLLSPGPGSMPRSKEICEEVRRKVVEAHQAGKGYKSLSKVFHLHRSTIRQIIYKWKVFNTIATRPRSGRPTKPTARHRVQRGAADNEKKQNKDGGGSACGGGAGAETLSVNENGSGSAEGKVRVSGAGSSLGGPAMEELLCCDICGTCFPTEPALERHQAEHLDPALHTCEKCRKVFKSAAGLKTHRKRKHDC